MITKPGRSFTELIRNHDARLAHNTFEDFENTLDRLQSKWAGYHGHRASFNWETITEKLVSAMHDVLGERSSAQITSHDLLSLHEHLNTLYFTTDNSVACSDACQVALDMAIKSQHSPDYNAGMVLVA